MPRLGKVGPMVLLGTCVLLGGCHGKDDHVTASPAAPAIQPSSLPAGQAGNNNYMAGSKHALHQRGAAIRREFAQHNHPPQ
jgi:hypothetical protein